MQTETPIDPPVISTSSSQTWTSILAITVVVVMLVGLALPMILNARDAARRTQSKNNLKQFSLALHNYHDVHRTLPIGWDTNSSGIAKHGVYIRVLPFMESSPVYSWVNFDVPWDHPLNQWIFRSATLFLNNPAVSQTQTAEGFGLLHYSFNQQLMFRNGSCSFRDTKDSAQQTWLAAEVADNFVPWGYPYQCRNPNLALNSQPESFGRPSDDGAFVALVDGSVRWVKNGSEVKYNRDRVGSIELDSERFRTPPYPDRFGIEGIFESIRILNYSKSGPEPITTEMVQTAINETPNAQSLIAPGWSPTESDIDMLKSLKHMHYLVIADPESQKAMDKLVAFTQLDTIVCDRKVIRDQAK